MFSKGKRRNARYFALCWQEASKHRLGIAVSRTIRKAARRNRIKRIVRELFRLEPEIFPKGELIVIAKSGTDALSNEALRGFLHDILHP